jgi:glycine cleavage system H protein
MSKIETNLKYTADHEWLKMETDSIAVIGITDFAQGELGELVFVEVNTVGKQLKKGDIFGTVEAVKTTSDLFLPVSGKIIEFNQEIAEKGGDKPGLINEDPYGQGWIIKLEVSDASELDSLLSASAYGALLK